MSLDINGDPNNPFWMLGQDEEANSQKEVHIGGVDLNLDDVSDEALRSTLVKVKGSTPKKVGDLSSGQLKEKIRRVWTTFAEFDLAMGVHELQGWQSDLESFERDLQKAGAKFEEIESKTDAVGKTVFGGKLRGKLDYVMRNKAVIRRLFGSDRLLGAHRAVSKEQIETFFSQNTGFEDWDQSRHNMRNRLRKVRDSRVKVMERQIEKMTAKELLWLIKEVDHPQAEFQGVVQKVRADHVYKRLSQIRDMEILDDDPSKEVLERDKQIVKDSLEMISRSSEQAGSFQKEIHKIDEKTSATSSEESIQQAFSSKTLSSRASRKRGVTRMDAVMRNKRFIEQSVGAPLLTTEKGGVTQEDIKNVMDDTTKSVVWKRSRENIEHRLTSVSEESKTMERLIEQSSAKELILLLVELDRPRPEFEQVVASHQERFGEIAGLIGTALRQMENGPQGRDKEVAGQFQSVLMARSGGEVGGGLELRIRVGRSDPTGSPTYCSDMHKLIEIYRGSPNKEDAQVLVKQYIQLDRSQTDGRELLEVKEAVGQLVQPEAEKEEEKEEEALTLMRGVFVDTLYGELEMMTPSEVSRAVSLVEKHEGVFSPGMAALFPKRKKLFEGTLRNKKLSGKAEQVMVDLLTESIFEDSKEEWAAIMTNDAAREAAYRELAMGLRETVGVTEVLKQAVELEPKCNDSQRIRLLKFAIELVRTDFDRDLVGNEATKKLLDELINQVNKQEPPKEEASKLVKQLEALVSQPAAESAPPPPKDLTGALVQIASKDDGSAKVSHRDAALALSQAVGADELLKHISEAEKRCNESQRTRLAKFVTGWIEADPQVSKEHKDELITFLDTARRKYGEPSPDQLDVLQGLHRAITQSAQAESVPPPPKEVLDDLTGALVQIASKDDGSAKVSHRDAALALSQAVGADELLKHISEAEKRCSESQRTRLAKFVTGWVEADPQVSKEHKDELITFLDTARRKYGEPSPDQLDVLQGLHRAITQSAQAESAPPPPKDLTGALVQIASKDDGSAKVSHRDAALALSQAVGADELLKHISEAEKRCNESQRTRLAKFVTGWIEADPQVSKEHKDELITFLDTARMAYGNPSSDQVDVLQGLHRAITQSAEAESSLGIESHRSLIDQIAKEGSTQSLVRETVSDLRMLSRDLFTGIKVDEFFGKGWEKKGDKNRSPNLVRAKDGFNGLGWVVVEDILRFDTVAERKRVWEFYADVAHQAMESGDFHSAVAINGGLGQESVARLKLTSGAVSPKTNDQQKAIRGLFDDNWKVYRANLGEKVQKKEAVYPFIGQEQSDRTFIIDGNEEEENQYSRKKLRLLGNANLAFVEQQQLALQEPSQPMKTGIQAAVKRTKAEKKEEWYTRSNEIEPRAGKKHVSRTPEAKQDSKVGGKEDSSPDRVSRIQSIEGEYELPPMEEDPGPSSKY